MVAVLEKPKFVSLAQSIIYGTLGISALSISFVFFSGQAEFPEWISNLLLFAAIATLPYEMGKGSNKARIIYAGVTLLSGLIMFLASDVIRNQPRFDLQIGILLVPVEFFVTGVLFTKECNEWFKKMKTSTSNRVK